jgi:pyridoxine kinase
MARILAISSQVARGHIGLSAAVPVLQRLGHEVWALPSIVLSNHPGHTHCAAAHTDPTALETMIDALDQNEWLGEVDAVLSGYLPSPEHVHVVGRAVRRLKSRRDVLYLCDPVLGDDPKGIYIDVHAATSIRHDLVPVADITTPNRFELGWLAARPTATVEDLVSAARSLGVADVLVTSALSRAGELSTLHVSEREVSSITVPELEVAPHGTGDLFAALVLGHVLVGRTITEAMSRAGRGVALALAASAGLDELSIVPLLGEIADAPPLPISQP